MSKRILEKLSTLEIKIGEAPEESEPERRVPARAWHRLVEELREERTPDRSKRLQLQIEE